MTTINIELSNQEEKTINKALEICTLFFPQNRYGVLEEFLEHKTIEIVAIEHELRKILVSEKYINWQIETFDFDFNPIEFIRIDQDIERSMKGVFITSLLSRLKLIRKEIDPN